MTKKPKHNSDDDGYDSDKPKKKKIKKNKGKKKPVKKRQRKIKIINPSIQTTLPPNPRPIAFNVPLVSGLVDKNDAKEIEKIKDNISKGAEVIQIIKDEIKEEKRTRGRPKGSIKKPVIIEEVKEKDIIVIPPSSTVKTRAQRAKSKTVIVEPYNIKSAIKPKRSKKLDYKKETKEVLTYKKIRDIVIDDKKLKKLMDEYDILANDIQPLIKNKTKLTKYLYEIVNKPNINKDEIDLFPIPDNAFEEGLNLIHKSPNKSSIFDSNFSIIKQNDESFDIFDKKNPFHQDLKDNLEEIYKLTDSMTPLTNKGLNMSSGGGSLDDSYREDSNLLSNLMNRDPFSKTQV